MGAIEYQIARHESQGVAAPTLQRPPGQRLRPTGYFFVIFVLIVIFVNQRGVKRAMFSAERSQ